MNVYFIRHTAVNVPQGTCYGQTDVPLKDTFPQEAAKLRAALGPMAFDAVYSSPLSRCTKLAEAVGYPNPILDPRLMEMNFGEWEMKNYEQINDPRLMEWFADYRTVAPTGGESYMEMRQRVAEFLDYLRWQHYRDVAVFTHGGVILHALILLRLLTPVRPFDHVPAHGSITQVML